jgi:O-antigen/teichoic acid export membrane protein
VKELFKRIISLNTIKYLIISYLSTILNILLNILTIRLLDSYQLGKITLGKSIFQSFDFSHFGIRFGMDRHLPHAENVRDETEIFSVGYVSSFLFSLLFVVFWIFYTIDDIFFYSCFYLSGLLSTLITVYRIYYRSQPDKKKFINLSLLVNTLPVIIQIGFLYLYGIVGFVISMILSYIFSFLYTIKFYGVKNIFLRKQSLQVFKKLLKSGYILFFSAIVSYFSTIGDRFFIADYWGLEQLGIFSIVMFFFSVFGMFSVNYTEMIMNKIIISKSFRYIMKQIFIMFLLVLSLLIVAYFILPLFVKYLMPDYLDYIPLMRLILVAALPYSGLSILNYYLHSLDKRNVLFAINIFCTISYFILLFYLLNRVVSLEKLIILKITFFSFSFVLTLLASIYFSRIIPEKTR